MLSKREDKFNPQGLHRKLGVMAYACNASTRRKRDRESLRSHWIANIGLLDEFGANKRPCPKQTNNQGEWRLTYGLHMCTHTGTHGPIWKVYSVFNSHVNVKLPG